ncbi:hypothetical protein AB835_10035 [Candidatus Endobugula sertula]|uniref:Heme biosynthesis operon protein HemX n=1 Tax=Candidatus Endobugula sertula TaxID=62101 RepID=A0A1D2QNS9_9GAMM|nr:hypothetical protein AB835_10035 [Candidatus Endobugula sertula]
MTGNSNNRNSNVDNGVDININNNANETQKEWPAQSVEKSVKQKRQTKADNNAESDGALKKKVKKDHKEATVTQHPGVIEKGTSWIGLLQTVLLLLIAVSLLISAYFGWQFWSIQNTRTQQFETAIAEQDSQYSQLGRQQTSLSSQLTELKKQQQSHSDVTAAFNSYQRATQQRLDAHAEQLRRLSGANNKAWMLEEARYLLRLANQRQLIDSDAISITGLLTSADAILRAVDDPQLFPVRDRINKEIVALKLAPIIDREGLYLQISALIKQVDQLPSVSIHSLTKQPDVVDITPSSVLETTTWYNRVWLSISRAVKGVIDKAIRIDDHSQPVKPLLSNLQQAVMRQNLRLMLEQAQIALLREKKVIYRQSLEKVVYWLDTHYNHFAEKQAMVNQIAILQRQRIVNTLPDISRSLSLLVEHIERYNQGDKHLTPHRSDESRSIEHTENKSETAS